jgi:hypothetical protein
MSHALQGMQGSGNGHIIGHDDLPSFWRETRLPTPQEQADALIRWVGDNQSTALAPAEIRVEKLAALIGLPIHEDGDAQAFGWLNDQLKPQDLYELPARSTGDPLRLRLTMKGWELHKKLKKANTESRTAFMAMQFGDAILDHVVEACFKPAVVRTGFELRKLTDQQPAGLIDNQIRAAIISGRFVVADLTHRNPGAYWEAGFAEGLGLPVIYTCQKAVWKEKKTHFNTNHLVTIIWEEAALAKAQDDLAATIRATFRGEAKQSD